MGPVAGLAQAAPTRGAVGMGTVSDSACIWLGKPISKAEREDILGFGEYGA